MNEVNANPPTRLFSATRARAALIFGLLLDTVGLLIELWTRNRYERIVIPLSWFFSLTGLAFCVLPPLFLSIPWEDRTYLAFKSLVLWLAFTFAITLWLLLTGTISWLD